MLLRLTTLDRRQESNILNRMRKLINAILMLLMLTPSMVCVMTFCPEPAAAKQIAEQELPPCHQPNSSENQGDGVDNMAGPMLMQDCTLGDLSPSPMIDLPAKTGAFIVLGFIIPALMMGLPLSRAHPSGRISTGPPLWRQSGYSCLLSTQRFRP